MTEIINLNAFLRLLFISFLTVLLMACNPPKGLKAPATGATKISPLSEKTATCESKIRAQMEAKSIQLNSINPLESQIAKANELIAQTTTTTYSVKQNKQINSIKLMHSRKSNSSIRVKYDLSLNSKEADTKMNLTLDIEDIHTDKFTTIMQQFSIGDSCTLKLTSTVTETIQNLENNNFNYTRLSFYPNGETLNESDKFSLSPNKKLANLMPEIMSPDEIPAESLIYIEKVGVTTIQIKKQDTRALSEFGLLLVLETQEMSAVFDGKLIFSIKYGIDKSKSISLNELGKQKTWTLPLSIWKEQKLGSSQDIDSLSTTSEISPEYLKTHNSIQLLTKNPITYSHFDAYWLITADKPDEKEKMNSYLLLENAKATYNDKALPADLISNDTIQSDLPQIKIIAQDILNQTTDREQQIHLLLIYLKNNYTYDYDMLKNNTIRPLSTEEALLRGKGVCQHYAVIFTALARALKIPTRIISGYLIANKKLNAHAWVESEIRPGTWKVIEPQSPDGLEGTLTRYYLPIGRALFLEDKRQNSVDLLTALITDNLIIKEAPKHL